MWWTPTSIGICIIILGCVLYYVRNILNKPLPGPIGLPLLGHALVLVARQSTLHLQLEGWREKYGDVYQLYAVTQRVVSSSLKAKRKN